MDFHLHLKCPGRDGELVRVVTLQLLITHSHILLRVSMFEGPWKTVFKEKDRHCTGHSCELWCSEAAGRRMGREGDNDNKIARIY